jgi:UDPglucose 6-dehydrogenase
MNEKFETDRILFSPEFLREGRALYDCLNPSRIVVGGKKKIAKAFAKLLSNAAIKESPVILTHWTAAEAIKLFANDYLAMRVAYFNEVDIYAEYHKLNAKDIIDGMCYDDRIGQGYNNPSFGYGGYCFPKDTKQLLANYDENLIPNRLVGSIVHSNEIRKDWITNQILRRNPNVVGIYRMAMKAGSDNYRSSAIEGIIKRLSARVKVVIYEPMCEDEEFLDCILETDLNKFKKLSDIIVANRLDDNIADVNEKVYTRDIYGDN